MNVRPKLRLVTAPLLLALLGVSVVPTNALAVPPPSWWYLQVCTETWENTVTGQIVVWQYQNDGTTISGNNPLLGVPVHKWGEWKQTIIVCAHPPLDGGGIAKPFTGADISVETTVSGNPLSGGPTITFIDLISDSNLAFSGNNLGQISDLSGLTSGLASTSTASGWLTLDPNLERIPIAIIELDYSGLSRFVEYEISLESSILYDQFGLPYQDLGFGGYTITIVPEPSTVVMGIMAAVALLVGARNRSRRAK